MLGEKPDIPTPNPWKRGETTQSPDTQILFHLLQSPSPKEASPHRRGGSCPGPVGMQGMCGEQGVPYPPPPPPTSSQPQTIDAFECSERGAVARPHHEAPEPPRELRKEIITPHMSAPGPCTGEEGTRG